MKILPHFSAWSVAVLFLVSGGSQSSAQVQEAFLKSSNSEAFDQFGVSVSISGTTAVVGAEAEASASQFINGAQADNSAIGAGAAFVFVRNGGAWSQQAYLKASNAAAGDRFGHAVAISDDTIAVSAWREDSAATGVNGNQADNNAADSGAVYVFVRSGTIWTQQAYLKPSVTVAGANFGTSVAIDGDLLVVGNRRFEANPPPGSLWVYRRTGTTWNFEARLEASDKSIITTWGKYDAADFGNTVAVSGNTIAAGCIQHSWIFRDDQGNDYTPGAVYVFTRSGGVWTEGPLVRSGTLNSVGVGGSGVFGISVALSGDTLAVGDRNDSADAAGGFPPAASNSGAAYVFTRSGAAWAQQARLKASNFSPSDQFGKSVALSGNNLVVGASGDDHLGSGLNSSGAEDVSVNGSGAAYVFQRSGNTWSQHTYIKASTPAQGDFLGEQVAMSGGLVIVSARNEDSASTGINNGEGPDTATQSGAAYIFGGFGDVLQLSDVDADGIPDFLETYFGTPLNAPNATPLIVISATGQVTLQWPAANPANVTVIPQWSPDLTTWLASGETKNGIPARTITVTPGTGNAQRATLGTSGLGHAALRLKVTSP